VLVIPLGSCIDLEGLPSGEKPFPILHIQSRKLPPVMCVCLYNVRILPAVVMYHRVSGTGLSFINPDPNTRVYFLVVLHLICGAYK
jgi:hypothetical protein